MNRVIFACDIHNPGPGGSRGATKGLPTSPGRGFPDFLPGSGGALPSVLCRIAVHLPALTLQDGGIGPPALLPDGPSEGRETGLFPKNEFILANFHLHVLGGKNEVLAIGLAEALQQAFNTE